MPFTNYPQGFAAGLSVRGMPLLQAQPGQVFWVNNSTVLNPGQRAGSNGNRGTFLDPFSTLQYALNMCMDGRGDIIMIGAGHQETIGDAVTLNFNCANVAIIGMGVGNARPTFTFNTAATANIPVGAGGVSIQNCLFIGNFLSITSCMTAISASMTASIAGTTMTVATLGSGTISMGASLMGTGVLPGTVIVNQIAGTALVAGTYTVNISQTVASTTITSGPQDLAIDNCEFRDLSSSLGFLTVLTGSSTANALSGLNFTNNKVFGLSTVSVTCAMVMTASCDRVSIRDNVINYPVTAGTQGPAVLATGANSITNFDCGRNRVWRPNTSTSLPVGISTSGTAWTGLCYDNYLWNLGASTGIWINTGTKLGFANNYSPITGAADKSGLINPAAV